MISKNELYALLSNLIGGSPRPPRVTYPKAPGVKGTKVFPTGAGTGKVVGEPITTKRIAETWAEAEKMKNEGK